MTNKTSQSFYIGSITGKALTIIVSAFSIAQKEDNMPYMKYGDWYIPNCPIRFPTESEALEYMTNRE